MAHARGLAAEGQVETRYLKRGATLLHRRWRGQGGEIDLVLKDGDTVVFVEVKSSKTHAQAADMLRPRQVERLCLAAEEFLGTQPQGSLTPMRIDVALLDQDGRIDLIENAFM
jgi:putative endonuclease